MTRHRKHQSKHSLAKRQQAKTPQKSNWGQNLRAVAGVLISVAFMLLKSDHLVGESLHMDRTRVEQSQPSEGQAREPQHLRIADGFF